MTPIGAQASLALVQEQCDCLGRAAHRHGAHKLPTWHPTCHTPCTQMRLFLGLDKTRRKTRDSPGDALQPRNPARRSSSSRSDWCARCRWYSHSVQLPATTRHVRQHTLREQDHRVSESTGKPSATISNLRLSCVRTGDIRVLDPQSKTQPGACFSTDARLISEIATGDKQNCLRPQA